MPILVPTLGVAIAAFCVWIGVRIFNRRERWAKWAAVTLLAATLVGYPLSFGPACWLADRKVLSPWGSGSKRDIDRLYRPLITAMIVYPNAFGKVMLRYGWIGSPHDERNAARLAIRNQIIRRYSYDDIAPGLQGRIPY